MKESIEFERPEGLPASAVPFVGFIGTLPASSHLSHRQYSPTGGQLGDMDANYLEFWGFPVPERTFALSADVSEEQLREIAGWPVSTKSDRTELVVSGRVVAAAKALVAEIDRSES